MITFVFVVLIALAISAWLILVARYDAALQRAPDFIIGRKHDPYLLRWYVIPRNRLFNVYLHEMRRSDDDRALHDHPWINVSRILSGGLLGGDDRRPHVGQARHPGLPHAAQGAPPRAGARPHVPVTVHHRPQGARVGLLVPQGLEAVAGVRRHERDRGYWSRLR